MFCLNNTLSCVKHTTLRLRVNIMETRSAEDIEVSTEKLLHDIKTVIKDGEQLLKAGARELGERGQAARERLAAALEVAKDTQRQLQERALSSAKATNLMIREHPYESLGIAFGIGVLVGILASRR
jgi:ElaB/YqjD/DUF883 family membrane-anchored ribosome-binding protein